MHAEERTRAERGGRRWRLSLSWPMMLLVGWAVYELTAQPGLAALVTCIKFGWADVRAAWWLRRVDPDRLRGQTCFWSYLAFGLWKVAVMAIILVLTLALGREFFMRGGAAKVGLEVLAGSLVTAAFGLGSSFLMTYLALFSALRNGVRIWLGFAPSRARRERFWPPRHGGVNAAPFVFTTTFILTFWMEIALFCLLLEIWGPGGDLFVLCALGGFGISLVCLFAGYFVVSRRLFAASPGECWTCTEDEEVYQLDLPGSSAEQG